MIKIATLFSGIGAPEWALKRLGIKYKCVLACDNGDIDISGKINLDEEIKKVSLFKTFREEKEYVDHLYEKNSSKTNFVKKTYLSNYKEFDEDNYFLDVTLLNGKPLCGKVDILIGGSPCQAFSSVGFQKGLEDKRGQLFFEFLRLIKEIKPKVFVYENVTGIYSRKNKENWEHMKQAMSMLGYKMWSDSLNAKDFGIPQIRNRLFVVGFLDTNVDTESFSPKKRELYGYMQDFLIESMREGEFKYKKDGSLLMKKAPGIIDKKYFLTPAVKKYVLTPGTKNWKTHIETDRKIARTLLSTMGNHHRAGVDNYVTVGGELRALSERECLRLMGFTDDFKIVVSKGQAYKQAGNSMVVDVIMAIIEEIVRIGALN